MNVAHEALSQVINGKDFDPPAKLLANIKPQAAVRVLPGVPYSIASNIAHADVWQRVWLARLEHTPSFNPFPVFPAVEADAWDETRSQFLAHLNRALELAETVADTDAKAQRLLLQIALHTTYHVGQVKLLKRMLRRVVGGRQVDLIGDG